MVPTHLSVADLDGVLCVVMTTTDWAEPRIVTMYWPTVARTGRLLEYLFDTPEEYDLSKVSVVQSRPSEYFVGTKGGGLHAPWARGLHILLEHGSNTPSIKTESIPAVMPKARKGTLLYWSGGMWVKRTRKKLEQLDPLTV